MAQRTAFLNSDAKGYNKDFHHTWISNYMLKQPGVMFSNYSTKPEFALGNGQIAGGKAIIRCTRTTGTFAGEEILACFESTATESISTSGNKKVFIEIPQVYVNDSTAITDTLTGGANLGVGRIVSDSDYPSHTNYIPLWEISNGDWQNATDVRPEVLRRGKPNTISYFGGNGEEERIDIDNSSLNKYLMSNGAGVAPSWEEGGGGGGGGSSENFKRTFTADENLLAKSMFGVATAPSLEETETSYSIGINDGFTKFAFGVILNGEEFNSLNLNLSSVNSPADSLSVRIETVDSGGNPTGTLIDVGAYGTASVTGTMTSVTVTLAGTISGMTAHSRAAVVLSRTGSASDSNYYKIGTSQTNVRGWINIGCGLVYSDSWRSLGDTVPGVSCAGFSNEAIVQAKSSTGGDESNVNCLGYVETGAIAGNDFTGVLQGTIDYEGATTGTIYYLSHTGTFATSGGIKVGECIKNGVVELFKQSEEEFGKGVELKIEAQTPLQEGDAVMLGFKYVGSTQVPTVKKVAARSLSLGAVDSDYAITQKSQSNIGLKTISVGYNKSLSVFYCDNKLTLCIIDEQLDAKSFYFTDYKAYDFDVTSPKQGYAAVIFSDRGAGGGQYPKAFAVNCNVQNEYGLTVGATITLEEVSATGNTRVGITNVDDGLSLNTVAAIWARHYKEGDASENGQTMYSILDIDSSTLALTATAPAVFNGNVQDMTQVPFGYLGDGFVGTILEEETVEGSVVTETEHTLIIRRYSGGTGAEGGTFGSMAYRILNDRKNNSDSGYDVAISGQPHQLFGVNGMVFVRIGHVIYICDKYPSPYVRYRIQDTWSGTGARRYYPVDGGKHLLCVDMERDFDNQRGKIRITKYEVGMSSLHEITHRNFSTGSLYINGNYPMPQITEIGDRNLWLYNDKDGDYYLTYITNDGRLALGETNSRCGKVIGIVKSNVETGQMATVITSGLVPAWFNEPGEKIYINAQGKLDGYRNDYPMGIGVIPGSPGKALLRIGDESSHNYQSI